MGVNILGIKKHKKVEAIVGEELHRVCLYSHGHEPGSDRTGWFYTMDGRRGVINFTTGAWSISPVADPFNVKGPSLRQVIAINSEEGNSAS